MRVATTPPRMNRELSRAAWSNPNVLVEGMRLYRAQTAIAPNAALTAEAKAPIPIVS